MKPCFAYFFRKCFRSIMIIVVCLICQQQAIAKDFLITSYGAKPGPEQLNTMAINKAIEACFKNGGGRVIIPAGVFRTGTLVMKAACGAAPGSRSCTAGQFTVERFSRSTTTSVSLTERIPVAGER